MKLEERVKKAADEIIGICVKYDVSLAPLYQEGVGVEVVGEETDQNGIIRYYEIEIMTLGNDEQNIKCHT